MLSPAYVLNGTIDIGATFYWEITLKEPIDNTIPYNAQTNSQLVPLDGKTPVATLMNAKGGKVADFACAYLDATDTLPQRIAMTMPRAITGTLTANGTPPYYLYSLDLMDADGITSDRRMKGQMVATYGQVLT